MRRPMRTRDPVRPAGRWMVLLLLLLLLLPFVASAQVVEQPPAPGVVEAPPGGPVPIGDEAEWEELSAQIRRATEDGDWNAVAEHWQELGERLGATLEEAAERRHDRDWDRREWEDRWERQGGRWAEWGEQWADWGESWGEAWGEWGEEYGERWGEYGEGWGDIGERWGEWGEQWGEFGERFGESFEDADWSELPIGLSDALQAIDWGLLAELIQESVTMALESLDHVSFSIDPVE